MIGYFLGSLAGRVATLLCVLVILLPYVLRRSRFSRGLGFAQEHATPYLRRLWPHFWLGYAILALSTLHAGSVSRAMARANGAGIWAATVAFFLLVFEVAAGVGLEEAGVAARRAR